MELNESSSKVYVAFDDYYDVNAYNRFLSAAKNNNVEYDEFLSIKSPFNRSLLISKDDLPNFLNYDILTKSDENWLISLVKATRPNEAYKLYRRPGQDVSYWDYILPIPLQKMHEKDYIMVFKGWDISDLNMISKGVKDSKIYKWGTAKKKGYGIYVCFNPYIKGMVNSSRVLLEYNKEGTAKDGKVPNKPGYIEYDLNHKVLVIEKLMDKRLDLEYHLNGKIKPLKKASFI